MLEPAAPFGFGLQNVSFSQQLDSLCMGFIMPLLCWFLCYQWTCAGWVGSFDSISIGAACPAPRRSRSMTGSHATTLLLNIVRRFYAQNSEITAKRLECSVCGRSAKRLPAARPLKHASETENPHCLAHLPPLFFLLSGVSPVLPIRPAGPRQALRCPWPGAHSPVHTAASIGHCRSLAGRSPSCPSPTSCSRLGITRRVSVPKPSSPFGSGLQNVSFS